MVSNHGVGHATGLLTTAMVTWLLFGFAGRQFVVAQDAHDVAMGTQHTIVVLAADPARRWVVYCQAREDTNGDGTVSTYVGPRGRTLGDKPRSFLYCGQEEPIDWYMGHDPSGRYVAMGMNGRLVLLDVVSGNRTSLGEYARCPGAPQAAPPMPRYVAFDTCGRRMVYSIEEEQLSSRTHVRNLAARTSVSVDFGAGLVWWLAFHPSMCWVQASVVAQDTNGSGRIEPPLYEASVEMLQCARSPQWVKKYAILRDASVDRAARVDMPETRWIPTPAGLLPGGVIVRADAGEVRIERLRGGSELVVPASDKATVVGYDWQEEVVLAHRRGRHTGGHLWLYCKGNGTQLCPVKFPPQGGPAVPSVHGWIAIPAGSEGWLFVSGKAGLVRYVPGSLRGRHDSDLLLWEDGEVSVLNLETGRRFNLGLEWDRKTWPVRAQHLFAAEGAVIDIARHRIDWSYSGTSLAISLDRCVLLGGAPERGMALGPVHWVQPP